MMLNTQKANKWTLILIGSLAISVVAFALIFDTGEPYDGPQVQGGVVLLCGGMMSIAAVFIGFPLAVKIMLRSGHIGFLPFASCIVGILFGFSAIVSVALGALGLAFPGTTCYGLA
jgi:membrane protease YdiL (CAAX protease family)